ncbi:class I SAM-dependent methyltransferase [Acinetobacter towneri]|uniref:class I SAM-dependent methyltransferase n=1 Tax=Acinetobacter towneri TaxID=202956 RepID=UPI001B838D13|nr:hypothetical protein DSM16313_26270 [Acinetobacter seohaensis]
MLNFLKKIVKATPLHPQWLLGSRKPPNGLQQAEGSFLDIGAGDRWLEKELPRSVQYTALDHPHTGIEIYKSKPNIIADAVNLPLADDSFDNIACLEVIEHVPDPEKVFSEIYRVLKSGGTAWISIPFLYPIHDAPFDFQRYSRYGLQNIAKNTGFQYIEVKPRLHALKTAGLLFCIAIAGCITKNKLTLFLMPIAILSIFIINILTWLISCILPNWENMTQGYEVVLKK